MAGQRTKLILGDVMADVSLVKTSSESAGARWESVELDAVTGDPIVVSTALPMAAAFPEGLAAAPEPTDGPTRVIDNTTGADYIVNRPAGTVDDRRRAAGDPFVPSSREMGLMPVIPQNPEQAAQRDAHAGVVPPATRRARGVTMPDGKFVDLTEQLAEIDQRVTLEGLTIAKAIPANAIPRDRVRGSFYIEPQDPLAVRVRDLLFAVLSEEGRALAVRWSKRTNQGFGIIVASKAHDALMLLEVEWGPNMRKASKKAQITAGFVASDDELAAARDFLKRMSAPASAIDTIADERRVLHTQLLEAAKAGEIATLPDVEEVETTGLAAALREAA